MINTDNFANRLQKVIDFYGESASSFAEKIKVQRSSISHVLSGRNKPSLDFVLKIISSFPEVELYWLLNGKGTFPRIPEKDTVKEKYSIPSNLNTVNNNQSDKAIERIVIFYSDGSFKNFDKQ